MAQYCVLSRIPRFGLSLILAEPTKACVARARNTARSCIVVYAAVQALAVTPSAELAKDSPATGTGTVTL